MVACVRAPLEEGQVTTPLRRQMIELCRVGGALSTLDLDLGTSASLRSGKKSCRLDILSLGLVPWDKLPIRPTLVPDDQGRIVGSHSRNEAFMALFSLRDVSHSFGGPRVLDHVDWQVERGERVCL